MQPHLLHVCIEILDQKNLPLLLGNRSLIKTKSTIKFGDHTLTIDWKNEKLCLPISLESSGHFYLQFYPMSQVEENRLTNDFVQQANWTKEETRKVVAYVAMEKKPKMEKIKEPGKLKEPGKRKLGQADLVSLGVLMHICDMMTRSLLRQDNHGLLGQPRSGQQK